MKILHILSTINLESGGPVRGVLDLSQVFAEQGHSITIASCDSHMPPFLQEYRCQFVLLGPAYLKYSFSVKLFLWLKHNINNYDVVIINGLWQYFSVTSCFWAMKRNIPFFVFSHGMLDPWFKRKYPFKHIKKLIYWLIFEHRVVNNAFNTIFTCEEEKVLARKSFPLYNPRESVCSYGVKSAPKNVNTLREEFFLKFPHLLDKKIILFMGRIHEKKGCDLLLDAFAKISQKDSGLHLVIAGPNQSSYALNLILKAKNVNIEAKVTFTGMLDGAMKWGAYYSAEIFCLPSHQENFGIVVAEALSCSRPVLISNKVNIWPKIVEMNAGFVADDTAYGTIALLESWLSIDEKERAKMRLNARKCFEDQFSVENAAKSMLSILNAVRA